MIETKIRKVGNSAVMTLTTEMLAILDAASLSEIAAAYAFGIAKAHAFVDGNKRTAFVTAVTFLRLKARRSGPIP